jgi:hypothetical protein
MRTFTPFCPNGLKSVVFAEMLAVKRLESGGVIARFHPEPVPLAAIGVELGQLRQV